VKAVASELTLLVPTAKLQPKATELSAAAAALDDSLLTLLSQNLARTSVLRPVLRRT
jgi:hypothetical protein